jgi:hypothetical protein
MSVECSICKRTFKNLLALNGHKRVHLSKDFNKEALKRSKIVIDATKAKRIEEYNINPKFCTECNKPLPYEKRNNKFCNHSCFAINNNNNRKINGWRHSEESKIMIAESVKQAQNVFSETRKLELIQKRVTTRRKNHPHQHRVCKICNKKINNSNKYSYCREHWLISKEFQHCLAHGHKNYKRGYVYNKWTGRQEYLLSSLEFLYYDYLTNNNIEWDKPPPLKYVNNGSEHLYFCDFYLPKQDLFIEVKGYMWKGDKEKMKLVVSQNPNINLTILRKPDILMLK